MLAIAEPATTADRVPDSAVLSEIRLDEREAAISACGGRQIKWRTTVVFANAICDYRRYSSRRSSSVLGPVSLTNDLKKKFENAIAVAVLTVGETFESFLRNGGNQ